MSDERELKLKITTTADTAGAKVATRDLEQVGNAAKKVAGEGKFLGQVGEAAKTAAKGTGEMAKESASAANNIGELSRRGQDVSKVFRGLDAASQGGTRGVLGLKDAMQGLGRLAATLSTGFIAAAGAITGVGLAGIALLRRSAKENEAAVLKIFADAAAGSDRLKASYAALETEGTKSLKAQLDAVEQLKNGFAELLQIQAAADKRISESHKLQSQLQGAQLDRDEQRALAGASTDEQRQKISASFAQKRTALQDNIANTDLESLKMRGQFQIQQGESQRPLLQRNVDEATAEAREKRAAADSALETSTKLVRRKSLDGKEIADEENLQAIESAKNAAKAADIAEKKLTEVVAATAAALKQIDALVSEGRANVEKATVGAELRRTQLETEALKTGNAAKPKIQELRGAANEAMANQDFAGQDKAAADIAEITKGVKEAGARSAAVTREMGLTVIDSHRAVTRETSLVIKAVKKIDRQNINSR